MSTETPLSAPAATAAPAHGLGGKYLTFFLAGEEYGLAILTVHEIIGLLPITRVPRTPDYLRGVVNLRGKVIPIVDLRTKFGLPREADAPESCIIVVQIQGVQIGIVVDRVSEVASIPEAAIEPPPTFGADVRTDFLLGLGKAQGRVKLLLDIDQVLATQEILEVQAVRAELE